MKESTLKALGEIFKKNNATLYAVGGFVREQFLKQVKPESDIDLCSRLTPDEVKKILHASEFTVAFISKELGVVNILCKGEKYTHTTFRQDTYDRPGQHRPVKVVFVQTPAEDMLRRDLTINALYQNVLTGEILNFFGEIKKLTSVLPNGQSFVYDSIRILRLARFAGMTGLKIDKETFKVARQHVPYLTQLSKKRTDEEVKKMLALESKPCKRCFQILKKLKACQRV